MSTGRGFQRKKGNSKRKHRAPRRDAFRQKSPSPRLYASFRNKSQLNMCSIWKTFAVNNSGSVSNEISHTTDADIEH
ncbi:hypothetical protein FKM82_021801 [Ascaphus truei]